MTKVKNGVATQIRKKHLRTDVAKWFAELDRLRGDAFFPEGRNQPILRGNIDVEKKRFFKLADRLIATSDPAKRKRIKEVLARMTFGKK
jgi:hypothetical protein